jgi:hypothetical protein
MIAPYQFRLAASIGFESSVVEKKKKKAAVKPLYLVCHRPPPYSGVFRHDSA